MRISGKGSDDIAVDDAVFNLKARFRAVDFNHL